MKQATLSELLSILDSAIDGRRATYLATPITTGFKFIEWARRSKDLGRDLPIDEVIMFNCDAAAQFARSLRSKFPHVINPAAFKGTGGLKTTTTLFGGP